MIWKPVLIAGAVCAITLSTCPYLLAGPYGDDLSKCLVSSTEAKDKTDLVRWIFAAAAQHPDVSSIAAVSGKELTEMARKVAKLYERLMTESCRTQYRDAIKYEGSQTIPASFSILGQVAMRGLMENPAVTKAFEQIGSFVDQDKIKAVTESPGK